MPEREGGMRESERERERRERILNKRGRETRSRLRGSVDRIILSLPPPFAFRGRGNISERRLHGKLHENNQRDFRGFSSWEKARRPATNLERERVGGRARRGVGTRAGGLFQPCTSGLSAALPL